MTGVLDLVPRSLVYWEALCGPTLDGMEQERWLKEIFVGRIVNPVTLHGQVIGSTVQRLGG